MSERPELVWPFLSRALRAARANASWPALRPLADVLDAAHGAAADGLAPPAVVDASTGLPPYQLWARLKADQLVARDEAVVESVDALRARAASSPIHAARLSRRRYHDALREAPLLRLGDLDVALKMPLERGGRRVLAVLDKIEVDGVMVRLGAEVSLDKSVTDRALFELLFAHGSRAIEQVLCALCALRGVREVERVTRGAVDVCAVIDAGVMPEPLSWLRRAPGTAACGFSFATCALDVAAGDNDVLAHDAPALAESARACSLDRTPPHRVFRDRKLVATPQAAAAVRARAKERSTKTLCYEVAAP